MKSVLLLTACLVVSLAVVEGSKSKDVDSGYWVTKEKKVCVSTFGEIVFVLDSSTSIGPEKWNDVLKFVDDVVMRVNRRALKAKGGVKVGVVVYNNFAKVAIPLGSQADVTKLRRALKDIQFTEGVTNTGAGLLEAQKEFKRQGTKNVSRTIILITDGASNFGPNSLVAANDIKATGVTILSVGVTDQIRESELVDIASDDAFLHVHQFKDLPKFVSKIAVKVCETLKTKRCKAVADVALVLDLSRSIRSTDLSLFREFLLKWSSKLAIGQGVRVAIFTFGKTARTELTLAQGTSQAIVRKALKNMKRSKGSNGGAGMEAAWREFKSHGRRQAAKVVLLISDARWNSGSGKRPFIAADAMQKMGVQIIAIGVTKKPKTRYLKRITDPKNLFIGISYEKLDSLLPSLLHKTCHVISYPPPKPKPDNNYCAKPKVENVPCEGKKPGMRSIELGIPLRKKCFKMRVRLTILCGSKSCPPLPAIKTRCALGYKITAHPKYSLKQGVCLPELSKIKVEQCKDESKPKPPKSCRPPKTKVTNCKGEGTFGSLKTEFFLMLNGKCRRLIHHAKILCPKKKQKCPKDKSNSLPCVGGLKLNFVDRFSQIKGICIPTTTVLVQRCIVKPPKSCGKKKYKVGKCRSNGKALFSLSIPIRIFGKCVRVRVRDSVICRKSGQGCPKILKRKRSKCFKTKQGRYRFQFFYTFASKGNMCVPKVKFLVKRCANPPTCGKKKVFVGKCGSNGKAPFSLVLPTRFFGKCLKVQFRGNAVCRKKGQKCSKKIIKKRSSKCFVGGRYRLEFVYRYVTKKNMCVPKVRFQIKRCKQKPMEGPCPSTKVRTVKHCKKRFGKKQVVMKLRFNGKCYKFKWNLKTYCNKSNEKCEKHNKQRVFKMCNRIGHEVILRVNYVFLNNQCNPYVSYTTKKCKK